jgi:hypothetical protein
MQNSASAAIVNHGNGGSICKTSNSHFAVVLLCFEAKTKHKVNKGKFNRGVVVDCWGLLFLQRNNNKFFFCHCHAACSVAYIHCSTYLYML